MKTLDSVYEQRPQYILNGDGSLMDEDQIFEDLKRGVAPETQRAWAQGGIDPLDLIPFGRWIRNSCGLWLDENPHTTIKWAVERADPENTKHGFDASPSHPDNYSGRVINRFAAWLRRRTPMRWPNLEDVLAMVLIAFVVTSPVACQVHRQNAITEMVKAGQDPFMARCSMLIEQNHYEAEHCAAGAKLK